MKRTTEKSYFIKIAAVLIFCAAIIAVAVRQATKLSRLHAEMRLLTEQVPAKRLEHLKSRYLGGYTVYYAIRDYSGIYPVNLADTLYDKLEMDRWVVERSDDSGGSIRFLVPEIGWNPDYSDQKNGGWYLNGEIGSSITLINPRFDPDGISRLWLEVMDISEQGKLFLIGQGRPDKPRTVL